MMFSEYVRSWTVQKLPEGYLRVYKYSRALMTVGERFA